MPMRSIFCLVSGLSAAATFALMPSLSGGGLIEKDASTWSLGASAGTIASVKSSNSLQQTYATLSMTPGGGVIYLAETYPHLGEIALNGGGGYPILITPANPAKPITLSRIAFKGVDNVRVSNVHVDSTGVDRSDFMRDIDITNSSRIEITNSSFTSNGSTNFNPNDPLAILGERLSMIRSSSKILFADNSVAGYEQGLTFQKSSQIRVIGNDIRAIQGDGIRLAGVEDVLIANNYLHDFSATPNEFTHSDFIQMWSRNTDTISRGVTITANVMDTGNGVAVQAIWLRNDKHDNGDTNELFQDITITDNLIYSGAANGIGILAANNVLVENNTLLWNKRAITVKATGDTSFWPRIRLVEVTNAKVAGNITPGIVTAEDYYLKNNILISYDPADASYVGKHFVNAANGGDIGPKGWRLRADSPWNGTGATASQSEQ